MMLLYEPLATDDGGYMGRDQHDVIADDIIAFFSSG